MDTNISTSEEVYRVWFEYLIRTPNWREAVAREEWPEDFPEPRSPELDRHIDGYGDWWGWRVGDLDFDHFWRRWQMRQREREVHDKNAFTLAEWIAWENSRALEAEEEDGPLSFLEREEVIRQISEHILQENQKIIERRQSFENIRYRFPYCVLNEKKLARHKRRLTLYQLHEIDKIPYPDILCGRLRQIGPLPFGLGPFTPDNREKRIWDHYRLIHEPIRRENEQYLLKKLLSSLFFSPALSLKKSAALNVFPKSDEYDKIIGWLKEEVFEAGQTIKSVQEGWFPRMPTASTYAKG